MISQILMLSSVFFRHPNFKNTKGSYGVMGYSFGGPKWGFPLKHLLILFITDISEKSNTFQPVLNTQLRTFCDLLGWGSLDEWQMKNMSSTQILVGICQSMFLIGAVRWYLLSFVCFDLKLTKSTWNFVLSNCYTM